MKRIALAALLTLPALGALAEPVYRCGNSYQQTPCTGAKIVDAGDSRTARQWVEAKAVAADERRLGREMERERLVIEARVPAGAAALSSPRLVPLALPKTGVAAARRAKVKQRRYVASERAGEFVAVAQRSKPR